jgi:hypothetical protein
MEWIFLGLLAAAGLVVVSVLWFVAQLILLPFRLLGLVLQLAGFVLALPFLLLGLVFALALGGVGVALAAGAFFLPLVPLILVLAGIVWLFRRRRRRLAPS